jgi:hypothetical protein
METRVVRLLTAIVVLLVILLVGGGIAVGVGLHTAQTRQQAAVAHLVETSSAARQALARFEAKRREYSGDPGGPLGRLDRQIQYMSEMVEEQMVLISELAGMEEGIARALGASPPQQRNEARAPVRRR